ncbi:MAG: ion transporter [Wenzhouxiangellaceae bacterium]|nr:ion transporter [Wenzhouxiangellaceae bacterium]
MTKQGSGVRERLGAWIESRGPRNFIIGLILVNAVIMGLETSPEVMARVGGFLLAANQFILGVFVVEILIKLLAFGPRFFRSGWNVFDFLIVGIALVPSSGPLEILRALRILRVLRLLSQVERLRNIIESLMRALPGMGWTAALLLLVFYIFAVMGTMMFGDAFPEYWGGLGRSFFSLFQIMTLESWSSGIARPMLEEIPLAWLYFVPFILVSSFMVLNLFIAIIVSATNSIHVDEELAERRELLAEIRQVNQRLKHLEKLAEREP